MATVNTLDGRFNEEIDLWGFLFHFPISFTHTQLEPNQTKPNRTEIETSSFIPCRTHNNHLHLHQIV
ncbi:hypothetical protein QVD17_32944 [Tagetes erecta]|uniref:Uncharacterized protein n=1 Tax=Tagetes erecta TaxID=13708 RepID=A0AAD8K0E9_TARER|nr:hypothetical protein QVD17_32944 [Tagetes erecta]